MNLLSDSGWVSDADVGLLPVHVLLVRCSSAVAKSRLVQSLEVLVLVGDHVTNGVLPDGGHFADVFRVAQLGLAESETVAGELARAGLASANIVLNKQHVVLVRVQSFHFFVFC